MKIKTLKQIQEENREFIIMANNPSAKTYKEALEMELGRGCKIIVWSLLGDSDLEIYDYIRSKNVASFPYLNGYFELADNPYVNNSEEEKLQLKKIIGKPLTLDRVLIALKYYVDYELLDMSLTLRNSGTVYGGINGTIELFKWDLTKETLEEQSEETQREINELISEI